MWTPSQPLIVRLVTRPSKGRIPEASLACLVVRRAPFVTRGAALKLSERLARLERFADDHRIARDLEVIRLQLARAEGKIAKVASRPIALLKGDSDERPRNTG